MKIRTRYVEVFNGLGRWDGGEKGRERERERESERESDIERELSLGNSTKPVVTDASSISETISVCCHNILLLI